jgi:hypothetical protein
MKIEVDLKLFQMLVECLDKQALLDKQDADTQARWKAIINETYVTANNALTEFKKLNMVNDGRTETGMGPIISPDKTPFV